MADLLGSDAMDVDDTDEVQIVTLVNQDGKAYTLAQCQAYVEAINEKRDKLPPPEATPQQPLPSDQSCAWCKRSRRIRNTIPAKTYARCIFLPFKTAHANECVPCRMALMWGYKGVSRGDMQLQLQESDKFLVFIFVVYCWEERYTNPDKCLIAESEKLPNLCKETITQELATVLESDLCLGNLWPTLIFEQWFGYKPEAKSLVTIKHCNKSVTGIILSPDFGMQIGVIRLTQKSMATLKRAWELGSNEDEIRPGALDEVWKRGQERHSVVAKGGKTAEGEAPVPGTLTQKKAKADDDDDFLEEIWSSSSILVVKAGTASAKGGASSSSGGSRRNANAGQGAGAGAAAGANGSKRAGKDDKQAADRLKCLQASAQQVFAAVQLLDQFQDPKACSSRGRETAPAIFQ
jgi:hypothetical protein